MLNGSVRAYIVCPAGPRRYDRTARISVLAGVLDPRQGAIALNISA